jgi:DNA polymerase III subunit gamma/tau
MAHTAEVPCVPSTKKLEGKNMTIQTEIKYAPQTINDVVFNDSDTEFFMKSIVSGQYPCHNLMLYGTNGNGKSTIANLVAKALTGNSGLLIQDTIEQFLDRVDLTTYLSNTIQCYGDVQRHRCVVVFHELDKYSKSLSRLWTVMDDHKHQLMVIFTTNDPLKFENAVRSRCDKYEFTQISPKDFAPRAQHILQQEGVVMTLAEVTKNLEKYTGSNRDVRDYLRTIDKMLALKAAGLLKATSPNTARPQLVVVSATEQI